MRQELRLPVISRAPDALRSAAAARAISRNCAMVLLAGDRAAARCPDLDAEAPSEISHACVALSLSAHAESSSLAQTLTRALPPICRCLTRDGGFIAAGYDATLDDSRALRDDSRKVIAALQMPRRRNRHRWPKLKHNNVLGYHIDATTKQAEALMAPPLNAFIHRQTNAGSIRFTTTELAELDAKIARRRCVARARAGAVQRNLPPALPPTKQTSGPPPERSPR